MFNDVPSAGCVVDCGKVRVGAMAPNFPATVTDLGNSRLWALQSGRLGATDDTGRVRLGAMVPSL
jgi:hypothetical protein